MLFAEAFHEFCSDSGPSAEFFRPIFEIRHFSHDHFLVVFMSDHFLDEVEGLGNESVFGLVSV